MILKVFSYVVPMHAKLLQLCPILCNPVDNSPLGFSVYGILQARVYWSRLPFPSLGDFPDPRIELTSVVSPALAGGFFTTRATWEVLNFPEWVY